ncbi:phage portal protein [Gulosibacter faecalis]|uniref:Phage portal protein n=1 Tax=Gulosibacter faecalis TaxID=272240 RepID=A0ABW5UTW9_9MICO
MRQKAVTELAREVLIPSLIEERERQQTFENWARGKHEKPYRPREATREYDALLEKSRTPFIGLVLKMLCQSIELRDYSPSNEALKDDLWAVWRGNRMPVRQSRLYRAAFQGGLAYSMLLPGEPVPEAKIYSAKRMLAVYQDPEADEWPEFAVYMEPSTAKASHYLVLDHEAVYRFGYDRVEGKLEYIEHQEHNLGVTPVVRYAGEMDDEGTVTGEVEPLIPVQASVDQSKFDLLMTETFASWKIRYITGMAAPDSEEDQKRQKMILERDRLLLIENPDAKAGALDSTDMKQYIEARRDAKQDLASIAQVPQKALLGAQANQSDGAEAQAAEEASMQRKLHDYETSFGESHQQWFRLAGLSQGNLEAWTDYEGSCDFRDASIRSMSQMADALGKIAVQLQVPVRALWHMIPNVDSGTVKSWEKLADADPYGRMLRNVDLGQFDDQAV